MASLRGLFNGLTSPRALNLLSALGWSLTAAGAVLIIIFDGGTGYDSYAYWLAGHNVLEGNALYGPQAEGDFGEFHYPPVFAQLWAPFALMPPLVFDWVWRGVCFLSLRYLAGSWRNVGLWCLLPLTLLELWMGNVTFLTAALTVVALRGAAAAAPWAGAFKIAPLLAVPYLWLVRRSSRRGLVVGTAALLVACAASFALDPTSWLLYFQTLTTMGSAETASRWGVITLVPNTFLDTILRLAIGAALLVFAIWRRSDRLIYVATIITVPVLAVWRLVPLLALPRLKGSEPRHTAATETR